MARGISKRTLATLVKFSIGAFSIGAIKITIFSFHRLVETVKSVIKEVNSLLNKIIVIVPLFSVLDELFAGLSEEPVTRKRNVTKSIVKTLSSGLIVSTNYNYNTVVHWSLLYR